MKIITLVGDSLSMIRASKEIFYKDTYAFKLQESLNPLIYHVVARNRPRNNILSEAEEHLDGDILFSESAYIILHLGIVDCAPRLFSVMGDRILHVCTRTPIVKYFAYLLIAFKSRYRRFFTKYFPKTYVSKENFKEKYEFIIKKTKDVVKPKKIIMINIADTNKENKLRSFNFEKNIKEYNAIIAELALKYPDICTLVDFFSATKKRDDLIEKDGIHLTKKGYIYLFRILRDIIMDSESRRA